MCSGIASRISSSRAMSILRALWRCSKSRRTLTSWPTPSAVSPTPERRISCVCAFFLFTPPPPHFPLHHHSHFIIIEPVAVVSREEELSKKKNKKHTHTQCEEITEDVHTDPVIGIIPFSWKFSYRVKWKNPLRNPSLTPKTRTKKQLAAQSAKKNLSTRLAESVSAVFVRKTPFQCEDPHRGVFAY
jgi:hypothetical protein